MAFRTAATVMWKHLVPKCKAVPSSLCLTFSTVSNCYRPVGATCRGVCVCQCLPEAFNRAWRNVTPPGAAITNARCPSIDDADRRAGDRLVTSLVSG